MEKEMVKKFQTIFPDAFHVCVGDKYVWMTVERALKWELI
jgi:hypothetical protein